MKRLQDIAEYVDERISSTEIELSDYVTTDCLLQNKNGRTIASNLPPVKCNLIKYQKNDILIANIRPYLKKIWYADRQGGASADVLVFRAKTSIDPLYLYAVFLQDSFYDYVMRATKGSKMPRGDKNHIMNYIVHPVSGAEEKRIGQIISNINTKIELNKKISRELEAMAKELYDYWFVQFDFPNEQGKPYKSSGGKMVWNETLKREIPEGWEVKKLGEVLIIKNGKDYKKSDIGIYPVYGSGGLICCINSFMFSGESILLPRKGTLSNILYVNEAFSTIDTMFYSEISNQKLIKYLFYALQKSNYTKLSSGTGRPSMTASAYQSINIILPTQSLLDMFELQIKDSYVLMQSIQSQSRVLNYLRDYLLPLLMNGQVRVSQS